MSAHDRLDIERVVDEAARGITAHEPPAQFSARVLARLDAAPRRRVGWWLIPAVAAGALGVAALAVVPRLAHAPHTVGLAPASATIAGSPRPADAVPDGSPAAAPMEVASAAQSFVSGDAWRDQVVPALPAMPALDVTSIQPQTLGIPQLDLKPLGLPPLEVAPIEGAGDRR